MITKFLDPDIQKNRYITEYCSTKLISQDNTCIQYIELKNRHLALAFVQYHVRHSPYHAFLLGKTGI